MKLSVGDIVIGAHNPDRNCIDLLEGHPYRVLSVSGTTVALETPGFKLVVILPCVQKIEKQEAAQSAFQLLQFYFQQLQELIE